MLTKDTLDKVTAMGSILANVLTNDQVNALVQVTQAIKDQAAALESARADFDTLANSYSNLRADAAELRARLADEREKTRAAIMISALAGCAADYHRMVEVQALAERQVAQADRIATEALRYLYPEPRKVAP